MKKIEVEFKTKFDGNHWVYVTHELDVDDTFPVKKETVLKKLKSIYGKNTKLLKIS